MLDPIEANCAPAGPGVSLFRDSLRWRCNHGTSGDERLWIGARSGWKPAYPTLASGIASRIGQAFGCGGGILRLVWAVWAAGRPSRARSGAVLAGALYASRS